ncbi:hypothetical protein M9H77_07906 [Catharanthus roseus]|uniref:Uncharacterized protein n=1 Tax=Catharanthus roseus TaxID=4058 RepID=A0ACC0BWD9_CATRO|nr:hypothetical protein M9H77_07906 [Catharanthus roseus]
MVAYLEEALKINLEGFEGQERDQTRNKLEEKLAKYLEKHTPPPMVGSNLLCKILNRGSSIKGGDLGKDLDPILQSKKDSHQSLIMSTDSHIPTQSHQEGTRLARQYQGVARDVEELKKGKSNLLTMYLLMDTMTCRFKILIYSMMVDINEDHKLKEEEEEVEEKEKFITNPTRCFKCNGVGHIAINCPTKRTLVFNEDLNGWIEKRDDDCQEARTKQGNKLEEKLAKYLEKHTLPQTTMLLKTTPTSNGRFYLTVAGRSSSLCSWGFETLVP